MSRAARRSLVVGAPSPFVVAEAEALARKHHRGFVYYGHWFPQSAVAHWWLGSAMLVGGVSSESGSLQVYVRRGGALCSIRSWPRRLVRFVPRVFVPVIQRGDGSWCGRFVIVNPPPAWGYGLGVEWFRWQEKHPPMSPYEWRGWGGWGRYKRTRA